MMIGRRLDVSFQRWNRGALTLAALAILLAAAAPSANGQAATTLPPIPSGTDDGLSQEDLEELVGPIALYPDVLLANVLSASVFPADVIAAQAMRTRGADPAANPDAAWDPSIALIATFPDVLSMMAEYHEWTTALGESYLTQPGDVMAAIQTLRGKAWENGALRTNEQQIIVREGPTVIIQPANPQVIFVPVYTPSVVFVRQPVAPVVIAFGVGIAVGAIWSSNVHCNWNGRCVAWGPTWWGRHPRGNVNVNINVNNRRPPTNININNPRPPANINVPGGGNRPGGRPGSDGSPWRPSPERLPPNRIGGGDRPVRDDFRGIGSGQGNSRIPQRNPNQPSTGRPPIGSGGGSAIGNPNTPSLSRPGGNVGGPTNGLGGTARPAPPQIRTPDRPARPTPTPPSINRPSGNTGGNRGGNVGGNRGGTVGGNRGGAASNVSRPSGGAVSRPSAPTRGSAFQPGSAGGGGGAARPSGAVRGR